MRSQNIPAPTRIRKSGQYFQRTGKGSKLGNQRQSRNKVPKAIRRSGNTTEPLRVRPCCDMGTPLYKQYAENGKKVHLERVAGDIVERVGQRVKRPERGALC